MQESTFLKERGVAVTSARFIVPSQTYAMSGITSVKMFREPPQRGAAIVMLIFGSLVLLGGLGHGAVTAFFGLIVAGIGAAFLYAAKAKYHVVLKTASGEAQALTSEDSAFIRRVVEGLNASIVHRG